MVHFTQFRFRTLFYSDIRMHASRHAGYPIRLSADHKICASPRGFSQLITAFFASQLHRHPPWTYLSLDHIILSALSLTFSHPNRLFSQVRLSGCSLSDKTFFTFNLKQVIPDSSLIYCFLPCSFQRSSVNFPFKDIDLWR